MDFDRLDEILKSRKMSRRKLAIEVGILPGTMSTAFSRRSGLSSKELLKIAKYLGVNPLYLEGLDDDPEAKEDLLDQLQNSSAYQFSLESSDAMRLTMLLEAFSVLNTKGRYEALKAVCNLTYVPEYVGGDVKLQKEVFGREDISDLVDAVARIAEKKRGINYGEG